MRQKSSPPETPSERTRKQYSAEEKLRIVLDGLLGEVSIAELCRAKASRIASIAAGRRNFRKPASAV
jgi:transposase-like protein